MGMREGFTLIEVTVAVLIVGIVAGALALSLAGPRARADLDQVVAEAVAFDRLTRQRAIRQGGDVQLVFDLDGNRLSRRESAGPGRQVLRHYALPAGLRLEQVALGGRPITAGRAAVGCSGYGCTPTYAMLISGPAGRRWVLLAGMTGQATEVEDERQLQQVLALATPGRDDAD